jgi:uncharacterized protein YrrD
MIIKAKDVVGLQIITKNEGKKIEDISDVIFDPQSNRVVAFTASGGGMFGKDKILLLEDVQNIGPDAVIVESESAVKQSDSVDQKIKSIAKSKNYLSKTKIITEEGKELGKVSNIMFDDTSGQVYEFEVSQGFKNIQSGKKRVKIDDIVTIGEDATIVRGYTEADIQEQGQSQGIQGAINKARDQSPNIIEQAKTSLQDVATATKDKFNEIKEHPKTQEAIENLTNQTQKAKETIKEKTQSDDNSTKQQDTQKKEIKTAKKTQEVPLTTQPSQGSTIVGKYAIRTMALPDGSVLIRQGDIITEDTLEFANRFGLTDQLALNAESERVITPTNIKDANTPQIIQ